MLIGVPERFAIKLELYDDRYGEFELIVCGKKITSFKQDNQIYPFKGDIIELCEWFEESKNMFFNPVPPPFPVPLKGNTIAEKDTFSEEADFIFSSEEEGFEAFEKLADWFFAHSWLSWDSRKMYSEYGVEFLHKNGVAYVERELFEKICNDFISEVKKLA